MKKPHFLSLLIVLFLVSPYLVLFGYFFLNQDLNLELAPDFQDAFSFTFIQAFFSSILATVFGVAGALGLIGIRSLLPSSSRASFAINLFVLLPGAVPVLFVILAGLNLIPTLSGFSGIVLLHSIINIGLVAVTFEAILIEKAGSYLELARVEGASLGKMIFRVLVPVLKKEIILIWLSVFAFCFTSFAVPLIVGGTQGTTVEVLIYELIRIEGDWVNASLVAALQSLFIFALTFTLVRNSSSVTTRQVRGSFLGTFVGIKPLALIAFLPSAILIVGLTDDLLWGFTQLFIEISAAELLSLAGNSFVIALLTAGFCLIALLAIAFAHPAGFIRKVILGFLAPSSILTGFALLILWRGVGFTSIIKISIGLTLIFVPILYRLGWDAKLLQLRGQMQTAETLGASRWLTFLKVSWPQLQPTAAKLSALAAFWAWGDFALSKMVAERTLSISLLVQSLMGSYRLSSATALVWLMFLGSALTYVIVWSLINVASRKPSH